MFLKRRMAGPLVVCCLVMGLPTAAAAAGLTILSHTLTDNGDGDTFADTRETVELRLTLRNDSGLALDGVRVGAALGEAPIGVCLVGPEVLVGSLAAGEVRQSGPLVLYVGPAARATVDERIVAGVLFHAASNQVDPLPVAADLTLPLDLDASGYVPGGPWHEGFEGESDDLGDTFTFQNIDGDDFPCPEGEPCNPPFERNRCQYSNPDWINAGSYGAEAAADCYPGWDLAQAAATWFRVDEGKSYGFGVAGERSLHFGVEVGLGQWTTPTSVLEAAVTRDPVSLGLAPDLVFYQQVSLFDGRGIIGVPDDENADRGVVQVQVVNPSGQPGSDWLRLEPFVNGYDTMNGDNFFNCNFDPVDDGNDELDFFDPTDPNRDKGPSSTCAPELTYSCMGETAEPFDPAHVCNAAPGSGLEGAAGVGTWIETRVDLTELAGRRIRLRFLVSGHKYPGPLHLEQFGPDDVRDDGWWIDDVSLEDTSGSPMLLAPDVAPNTELPHPPDADGDAVVDTCDNCDDAANPEQADNEADGLGDVCDPDDDNDTVADATDNCALTANPDQADFESDGAGDACDDDDDDDGVPDAEDSCLGFNPAQLDNDLDAASPPCDCDDEDPTTFPGASEVNDGADNQCPGDLGYGAIDEISGSMGFFGFPNVLSWPAQAGATRYEVARAASPDFVAGCFSIQTNVPTYTDPTLPAAGVVLHYLVRVRAPHRGSWGLDSSGNERIVPCPP